MSKISRRLGEALEYEASYEDGDVIVREGDPGRDMFLVRSGAVVISRRRGDDTVELARLGPGEFFGEMSLLESMPRDADAHASGRTRVLAIGPGGLLLRLRRDPSLAIEMLNKMSARVRALNDRLDALGSVAP